MTADCNRRLLRAASRAHLPRRTVRLRLTVLYGALFTVCGAALLTITYFLVRHATGDVLVTQHNGGVSVSIGGPVNAPVRATGSLVGGPAGLTPQQLLAQAHQLQQEALHQHAAMLHQLLRNSGIALAVMAALSIALGWIIAGRVLRPLRTITTTAHHISATSLHQRLALNGPDDELKELGDTFDALLARLDASFQSQRQFVANASHELRTPLARQRTLIQVALADPDGNEQSLRTAHERSLVANDQQEQLIGALLTLARGQAGLEHQDVFDLAALIRSVLAARQSEIQARNLRVDVVLPPTPAVGDPRLVEQLVANLIDNAMRHNVSGGRVEVVAETTPDGANLTVTNTGPIVPTGEIADLFQPFNRLGADRTGQGLGLGLSIVQAIADAHHAPVTAHAQSAGGLRVQVHFRADAAPLGPLLIASLNGKTSMRTLIT